MAVSLLRGASLILVFLVVILSNLNPQHEQGVAFLLKEDCS